MPDVIVKLGGSLLSNRVRLDRLLAAINDSPRRVLVVPGGGPFADAVRGAFDAHGFGEEVAHAMAVKATEQFGLLLAGISPGFVAVGDGDALAAAFSDGQQAVALASGFLDEDCELPRTWAATSDAIAAWFADHLSVPQLVLVKSCNVAAGGDLRTLAAAGIVDKVCADVVSAARLDVQVFGAGDDVQLISWLAQEPEADKV